MNFLRVLLTASPTTPQHFKNAQPRRPSPCSSNSLFTSLFRSEEPLGYCRSGNPLSIPIPRSAGNSFQPSLQLDRHGHYQARPFRMNESNTIDYDYEHNSHNQLKPSTVIHVSTRGTQSYREARRTFEGILQKATKVRNSSQLIQLAVLRLPPLNTAIELVGL